MSNFFWGVFFSAAVTLLITLSIGDDKSKHMMERHLGTQVVNGVVYNVSIDSTATDSLHKIEWRKK